MKGSELVEGLEVEVGDELWLLLLEIRVGGYCTRDEMLWVVDLKGNVLICELKKFR